MRKFLSTLLLCLLDSDRQRVFEKLVFPADDKRDSGLPASFLETGEMNW